MFRMELDLSPIPRIGRLTDAFFSGPIESVKVDTASARRVTELLRLLKAGFATLPSSTISTIRPFRPQNLPGESSVIVGRIKS